MGCCSPKANGSAYALLRAFAASPRAPWQQPLARFAPGVSWRLAQAPAWRSGLPGAVTGQVAQPVEDVEILYDLWLAARARRDGPEGRALRRAYVALATQHGVPIKDVSGRRTPLPGPAAPSAPALPVTVTPVTKSPPPGALIQQYGPGAPPIMPVTNAPPPGALIQQYGPSAHTGQLIERGFAQRYGQRSRTSLFEAGLRPRGAIRAGSVIGCIHANGCAFYPPFSLEPGVAQGDVRREGLVLPPDAEMIVLDGPIPVPDDIQAPIRTVSVHAFIPRVDPGGSVYRVRYTGIAQPLTGDRRWLMNAEGYVNAAHVRFLRELPPGPPVR